MRLECVCRHDTEVVTAPLESGKEVYYRQSRFPSSLNICRTGVLLGIRIDNRSIGKDHFEVNDVVRCPSVLGTEETQATYGEVRHPIATSRVEL